LVFCTQDKDKYKLEFPSSPLRFQSFSVFSTNGARREKPKNTTNQFESEIQTVFRFAFRVCPLRSNRRRRRRQTARRLRGRRRCLALAAKLEFPSFSRFSARRRLFGGWWVVVGWFSLSTTAANRSLFIRRKTQQILALKGKWWGKMVERGWKTGVGCYWGQPENR